MAAPSPDVTAATDAMLTAAGIVSTPESRAEARRKLDKAARELTPEVLERRRARLGISPAA